MTLDHWLLFVAVAVLPVMSPGPAILLALSNAIRFGPSATLYSAFGNMLGLTILGFAVGFGLAAVMAASAYAFTIVKLVGAAYLVYLGCKVWRGGNLKFNPEEALLTPKSRRHLFLEALGIAVTNPKGLVLLAALLPPFVNHAEPVLPQIAILSMTFGAMCFVNHLFLAYASNRIKVLFASEPRMKALNRGLGTLFIGFGTALAFSAR